MFKRWLIIYFAIEKNGQVNSYMIGNQDSIIGKNQSEFMSDLRLETEGL